LGREENIEVPLVEDYFYNVNAFSADGNWGANLTIFSDISIGVEFPWYSNNNYIGSNLLIYAYAGGDLEIEITLLFLRLNIVVDLLGARANFFNFHFLFNAPEFTNYCYEIGWDAEAIAAQINVGLDILECRWGLLGQIITTQPGTICEWSDGYIAYPIFYANAKPEDLTWEGDHFESSCSNPYVWSPLTQYTDDESTDK
jgi:hypothetical protein